ncbi:hypothetical protein [Salinispora arenicola]|uniref:hypothetical protein n=1 Tax=Salinispora arenicola TaxID=168697 RepID=UPI00036F6064|nr:hypothetical protein [Salinispora arenicola]
MIDDDYLPGEGDVMPATWWTMTHRLWWRVEGILPLAEQAAGMPRQRKTRQQDIARWPDVPALIWYRDRASNEDNTRYVISQSRGDVLPADAIWVPATVTCDTAGGGYYRALVADGYTALDGGLLCRFPRAQAERMANTRIITGLSRLMNLARFL